MTEILEIFTVTADPESGEWDGEPEPTGCTVAAKEWAKMQDTDAEHYDTFVYDLEAQAEHALIIRWREA